MKATANTGTLADDVFYFGNAPGDTGNAAGDALVNAADFIGTRLNSSTFLDPATIDSRYDYNRDGQVNAIDLAIVRDFSTSMANALHWISPIESLANHSSNAKPGHSFGKAKLVELDSADSSHDDDPPHQRTKLDSVLELPLEDYAIDALLASMATDNTQPGIIVDANETQAEVESVDRIFAGIIDEF